jgi:hypothetical protein
MFAPDVKPFLTLNAQLLHRLERLLMQSGSAHFDCAQELVHAIV